MYLTVERKMEPPARNSTNGTPARSLRMPGREKQGFSSQCTPPTHHSDYDAHQTPAPGFLGAKFMTMLDLSACGVGNAGKLVKGLLTARETVTSSSVSA